MRIPLRLLKAAIWIYVLVGVLIILTIAFALFVLPLFSSELEVSTDSLDLMEKILLWWGIVLLPFLKIGQAFVKRHQREENVF